MKKAFKIFDRIKEGKKENYIPVESDLDPDTEEILYEAIQPGFYDMPIDDQFRTIDKIVMKDDDISELPGGQRRAVAFHYHEILETAKQKYPMLKELDRQNTLRNKVEELIEDFHSFHNKSKLTDHPGKLNDWNVVFKAKYHELNQLVKNVGGYETPLKEIGEVIERTSLFQQFMKIGLDQMKRPWGNFGCNLFNGPYRYFSNKKSMKSVINNLCDRYLSLAKRIDGKIKVAEEYKARKQK